MDLSLLPARYALYHHHPENYLLQTLLGLHAFNTGSFRELLIDLAALYKQPDEGVYYHNITHAFDVMTVKSSFMQTMDEFMKEINLAAGLGLSAEDRTLILLAAYAHDNGHEGLTNEFYNQRSLPLALTYSYASPLENMHASNLMTLIHKHDVVIPLAKKKMMISMILATDNCHHHSKLKQLQLINQQKTPLEELGASNKQLLLDCLIHAADIGSPAKDPLLFDRWSHNVRLEF